MGANLGVTTNTSSLKWKNLKKMIIVRNGKGKTFEEAVNRRKTGNTLAKRKTTNNVLQNISLKTKHRAT